MYRRHFFPTKDCCFNPTGTSKFKYERKDEANSDSCSLMTATCKSANGHLLIICRITKCSKALVISICEGRKDCPYWKTSFSCWLTNSFQVTNHRFESLGNNIEISNTFHLFELSLSFLLFSRVSQIFQPIVWLVKAKLTANSSGSALSRSRASNVKICRKCYETTNRMASVLYDIISTPTITSIAS